MRVRQSNDAQAQGRFLRNGGILEKKQQGKQVFHTLS
jgi:hypothetical protein